MFGWFYYLNPITGNSWQTSSEIRFQYVRAALVWIFGLFTFYASLWCSHILDCVLPFFIVCVCVCVCVNSTGVLSIICIIPESRQPPLILPWETFLNSRRARMWNRPRKWLHSFLFCFLIFLYFRFYLFLLWPWESQSTLFLAGIIWNDLLIYSSQLLSS